MADSASAAQSFVSQAVQQRAAQMTREEADGLTHGAVRLDDDGTIEVYNQYESDLAGFDPADAVGNNFFTELAPCTNNRLFRGRFMDGVAADKMDVVFPYTFTYRMAPTLVMIHLLRVDGVNWLFVKKAS
ncbi:MAG: photoactive yellow protein [Chloroflexota bacterium]|nr:photoactive yellow protein [Chloroflexota bacterium]